MSDFDRSIFTEADRQVTCRCDCYPFPHRLGGGHCRYDDDALRCSACQDGYCEYHRYWDGYDDRAEALTAWERNR